MDDSARAEVDPRSLRTAVFGALAAYILVSPFFVQVLGVDATFIRPWIMFKDVGVGVLKGEFVFTAKDGGVQHLSPLDVLGEERYPVRAQAYRFEKLVFKDEDVARFTSQFCAEHAGDYEDLRFEGKVGAGAAWRPVSIGGLCAGAVK